MYIYIYADVYTFKHIHMNIQIVINSLKKTNVET